MMNNSFECFFGQKILVTGASGFIGSHLCRQLCSFGAEVHTISRSQHSSNIDYLYWHRGDLANIETVRNLIRNVKPAIIFHLASHVTGSRSLEFVLPTFESNLVSSVNLLNAAAEIGCRRFVLTGSLEEPESSDSEAIACSPYAAAKWASTAYAHMFHKLYQVPVVITRLFMVYGPGQKDLKKLIPYVILSLLQGQAPKLSSGQRQIDWIYVNDVVEGLLAVAQKSNVEGHTFDLGSATLTSIHDVIQQLISLINPQIEPLFGAIPDRPMERVRVADTSYTYSKIGWQPTTSLERGLEETVNWYKKYLKDS